jgi:hypothetical protein
MTDQERNQLIAQKLGEGMSLSDLQKLLAREHNLPMTYLELRLLAADLPVKWKKEPPRKPEPVKAAVLDEDADDDDDDGGPPHGRTVVTVSKLVRPGAAMSGEVTFASGAKAEWFLDAMGRLGLNPAPDSKRPTQDDVRVFQVELQRKLSGMG